MSCRVLHRCFCIKDLVSLRHVRREDNACYIAFVKQDSPIAKKLLAQNYGWDIVRVSSLGSEVLNGARRMSRIPKITPGSFFSTNVKYAVYFDSSLSPIIKPSAIESFMIEEDGSRVVIAMHAHHLNMRMGLVRTPMEEIDKVLETYGSSQRIMLARQSKAYQKASLSMNLSYHSMPVASFIIHDLHTSTGLKLRCSWLNEYMLWADRDQPPLYFVLAKAFQGEKIMNLKSLYNIGNMNYLKVFNNTSGCKGCEVHYRPFFIQTGVKGYSIESRNDG